MTEGGVGFAGLAAAIPGLVDLCIDYGEFLKEKIRLYRETDDILKLRRFVVQLVEGEMHTLLAFLKSLAPRLTLKMGNELFALFQGLRDLLEKIKPLFSGHEISRIEKLIFSFYGSKILRNACDELEAWHNRFLRRAIVLMLFSGDSMADKRNATSADIADRAVARIKRIRAAVLDVGDLPMVVRLAPHDIGPEATWCQLANSDLWILKDMVNGDSLAEYRTYESNSDAVLVNSLRIIVRELATKLQFADPNTMGVLGCRGYSQDPLHNRFILQFPYPDGKANPRSLQNLLMAPENRSGLKHSISDRVNLAKKIASAVLYIHSCGFVHKNIRADNIIVFEPVSKSAAASTASTFPESIGEPYLVGYDGVRKADARSSMIGEEDWERKVYLDPQRHRMQDGDEFTMRHDIYSLGVVLLEVACWSSFTNRTEIGKYIWTQDGNLLAPNRLHGKFEELARRRIPPTLGNKYLDVVISCLTGLKEEEDKRGLEDEDEIVMGTAYITQIMSKLEGISL